MEQYFSYLSSMFNKNYFDFLMIINDGRYTLDEVALIKKAYDVANVMHDGQKRKNGIPFITHPLNVAYFLAYYHFDYKTICAALLHDTIEDTKYTKEELLNDFNEDILCIVDGVTKMKGSDFSSKKEAVIATHNKILNSITKDARIIAVKLVDRLHNMFTLNNLKEEKQIEIANETNEFYVNLARILGVYHIKDELQDLSLFYLNKEEFLKYFYYRCELLEDNKENIKYLKDDLEEICFEENININSTCKIKNVGGIYNDIDIGITLDRINDLIALRCVTDSSNNCFKVIELIKENYACFDKLFYDYISNPKYNGYKSLNINILNKGTNTQLRVRTNVMQRTNELGIVSNWSNETQEILNKKCNDMFLENKKELLYKKKNYNGGSIL